jgi:2,5-diamino-6-(ribosylamino)-4(3H)-pyrimidinone 5'-phosphate reductase
VGGPVPAGTRRGHVVVHVAVSLDGATTGFEADVGTFYELAAAWREDVTLTGADTVLAQEPALAGAPGPGPAPDGPLLVVVDSRGRVREWAALRDAGHWRDVLAVSTERTPPRDAAVPELVMGRDRVDLGRLLTTLAARHRGAVVRVDSGGTLTGALLAEGLVDEISLLVHPVLAGPAGNRWAGVTPRRPTGLRLDDSRRLPGGLVWLRYRVGAGRDG